MHVVDEGAILPHGLSVSRGTRHLPIVLDGEYCNTQANFSDPYEGELDLLLEVKLMKEVCWSLPRGDDSTRQDGIVMDRRDIALARIPFCS